jgi:exonuclease 3'-5' domain-containing protein 1
MLVIPTKATTSVPESGSISSLEKQLAHSTIGEAYELIDCIEGVLTVIENLTNLPTKPPSLYIDLEGVHLSRQGSISILQIHVAPQIKSYLIDIHTLGSKAFDTSDKLGCSLRSILQSKSIPKVFFDVRNDSDALFSHFQISLAGVIDLQVMEFGTRIFSGKCVNGLARCIDRDLSMSLSQKSECQRIKERGLKLFAPEKEGTYEVFNTRPLLADIGLYCVQDVQWLPALYQNYSRKLSMDKTAKVACATLDRIKESQSPSYEGHGRHKALGPW